MTWNYATKTVMAVAYILIITFANNVLRKIVFIRALNIYVCISCMDLILPLLRNTVSPCAKPLSLSSLVTDVMGDFLQM